MLHDWLHENITYLESNPFRGEMELEPLYCQIQSNTATHLDEATLDQQCDFIAQMLTEACGQCPDDPAVLREMVKDPEKLREYLLQIASEREAARASAQDDPDAEEELFTEDGYFYQEHEHDAFAHARASRDQEEVARLTPLFNKSSLKHLYRKLALALHPDREQDPAKREEKTRIMGQLSHAWEHKDMFTLLQLAHTHLPESKDLLSEENLAFINPLLKRRINELILSGFQGPDGLLGAVVNRFKQTSKKKTELAFTEHHDYLVRDIESLTAQLAKITTLQTLKPFLAARWDEQQQAQWDDEPELDWMFR
ncbi:DnaJ domain protein [compost metagenome]